MVFENAQEMINKVSDIMNLSEKEKELLVTHKSIKHDEIEVDGKKYPAWRIIHNNALGPGKGGIRYHLGVSEDEVKSLSFWMSLKNSLSGLPFGGAKGGVKVNPKELDQKQIEKISRAWVNSFHEVIGQDKDIPAPDVYTNPQVMSWMLDEFEKIKNRHEPGFITGKPLGLGGCPLRADSTSKGGYIIIDELVTLHKLNKKDITIAIQGFGNAGWNIAKFLYKNGYKVIAVSDSKGGILSEEGLNIFDVRKTKDEKRTVIEHEGKKISNAEILELDVNILILAALENQITQENADSIKAKYILELANGPVNPKADKILHSKQKIVVPDILANSGGVVGSYFEWVQNKTGQIFQEEFLEKRFSERMKESFNKVHTEFEERKREYDMRTISYIIAIKRILEAEKLRGNL